MNNKERDQEIFSDVYENGTEYEKKFTQPVGGYRPVWESKFKQMVDNAIKPKQNGKK